jgi:hypothetical protein
MTAQLNPGGTTNQPRFFYGWYIVGVAILVNIAGTFAFSSTLSIFLKPITEELGVSRGGFSLIRTFEIGVAAMIVPLLGPWIDRHGGRGILVSEYSWKEPAYCFPAWCKISGSSFWCAAR